MKALAYAVHLFTASGLIAGFLALLAIENGDFRVAMFWMLATLVIDGVDGTFARLARVKEVLPRVDGKTIDYVIDFFTYAILSAYFFYHAVEMPYLPKMLCVSAMLLSAAIYYGMEGMVSADGKHFVGFPVLWNMVVYLFVFVIPGVGWPAIFGLTMLFTILHFVPILVPYPSRGGRFWVVTLAAVIGFLATAVWNVWVYPDTNAVGRWGALICSLWFVIITILDTIQGGDGARVQR